jgi:hypothetical protein
VSGAGGEGTWTGLDLAPDPSLARLERRLEELAAARERILAEVRHRQSRGSVDDQRSNEQLLNWLIAAKADVPRWRLHIHPRSAIWISLSVQHHGLGQFVEVVPDRACRDLGRGWVEALTAEQWRAMRDLVGTRVEVFTPDLGRLVGTLVALDHAEARLDLGDGDVRYLTWLSVQPAAEPIDGHVDGDGPDGEPPVQEDGR